MEETLLRSEKGYKRYEEVRAHFIERLSERYSISITEDEYEELVKKLPSYTPWYRINTNNRLVSILIKDRYVLCHYRTAFHSKNRNKPSRKAALTTCLTETGWLPCPDYLKRGGYDKMQFEHDVNHNIKHIMDAAQELSIKGDKYFFLNSEYPSPIKKCAKQWLRKGWFEMGILVNHLITCYFNPEGLLADHLGKTHGVMSRIDIQETMHNGRLRQIYVPQISIGLGWYNVLHNGSYILKESIHEYTGKTTDNKPTAELFLNIALDKLKQAEETILKYRS